MSVSERSSGDWIWDGSYAMPWDELTEQQQTARLDLVLECAENYIYVATRDAYRSVDAKDGSPDFCSAQAVEDRRKYIDRRAL